MTLAIIACAALALATFAIGIASLTGSLPRNYFAGIKTGRLLRDDTSWKVGHKAAAPAFLLVSGLGLVAIGLIVLWNPDRHAMNLVMLGYIGVVILGLAIAAWMAGRAVGRADGER